VKYTQEDICRALLDSGIKAGDSVFFTTSLGMIGTPPSEIDTTEKLNELFLNAIIEVVKDGNIIVPTYSYTFGKANHGNLPIFDLDKTKPEIGPFPSYILSRTDFVRSEDPFMSIACKGKGCVDLISNLSNSSYGEGSFFSRIVKVDNFKCCSIGLGPNWTPFIHYADWLAKAPYRYDKEFYGYIRKGVELKLTNWIYSVPCLIPQARANGHRIGRLAEKHGIWRSAPLGRARVYSADCRDYFNFVMEHLAKDPWLLAKGPPVDVLEEEQKRMCDSYDLSDADFKNGYMTKKYRTGERVGSWLVPEKWVCHHASLKDSKGNILSTQALEYSASVKIELDREDLKGHIFPKMINLYKQRDWGFVYNGILNEDIYSVEIESDFGFGEITVFYKKEKKMALLASSLIEIC